MVGHDEGGEQLGTDQCRGSQPLVGREHLDWLTYLPEEDSADGHLDIDPAGPLLLDLAHLRRIEA
jgi:hypothetical protein